MKCIIKIIIKLSDAVFRLSRVLKPNVMCNLEMRKEYFFLFECMQLIYESDSIVWFEKSAQTQGRLWISA